MTEEGVTRRRLLGTVVGSVVGAGGTGRAPTGLDRSLRLSHLQTIAALQPIVRGARSHWFEPVSASVLLGR